jgi:hypothetical protein
MGIGLESRGGDRDAADPPPDGIGRPACRRLNQGGNKEFEPPQAK